MCNTFECVICQETYSCLSRVSMCVCKNMPRCLVCWSKEMLIKGNVCSVCKTPADRGFPWWAIPILNRGTAWFRARGVTGAFADCEVVSEFCHIFFISLHAALLLMLASLSYLYPNPILIMPLLALQAMCESLCWSRSSSITVWAVALPTLLLFYPIMIVRFFPFIGWLAVSRFAGWFVDPMLLFAIRRQLK